MFYRVEARLKPGTELALLHKLTDGEIAAQQPDGPEIIASMKRARIDADGVVRWSEKCFCPTPLEHERQTVYDHFFTDLETEEIDDYVEVEGRPFMAYLEEVTDASGGD